MCTVCSGLSLCLETFMGLDQRTEARSKQHKPRVVSN